MESPMPEVLRLIEAEASRLHQRPKELRIPKSLRDAVIEHLDGMTRWTQGKQYVIVQHPATEWDALKLRWLPAWCRERWPNLVRWRVERVDVPPPPRGYVDVQVLGVRLLEEEG